MNEFRWLCNKVYMTPVVRVEDKLPRSGFELGLFKKTLADYVRRGVGYT